ncbi:MAG: hypothetical protein M1818_001275 [Claussenomyces sp. TS43310]|nr:MAG: hypothetical protein M1818_001275 [Claussenomyces sp. TS43310]
MTTVIKTMVKSVCIVGAGPSGLVAAKTLLHDFPEGSFAVTVFEQSDRIGGLWPLSHDDSGMVSSTMPTNISRHNVSFSDLSWPETSPSFPKAWQVGQYLKRYTETYSGLNIRTLCRVSKATRSQDGGSLTKRWKVEVQSQNSVAETHDFEHLIVGSGFFGTPRIPEELKDVEKMSVPVQHSADFRTLKGLLRASRDPPKSARKILVVGGSLSGVEVAASIAFQLSADVNAPQAPQISDATSYTVQHILPRPCRVLPYFIAASPMLTLEQDESKPSQSINPAPTFLPLDLAAHDITRRPPGPLVNSSGGAKPEAAEEVKDFFQSLVGDNQMGLCRSRNQGAAHTVRTPGKMHREAPWTACSDHYAEFVHTGQIKATKGRVTSFAPAGSQDSVVVSSEGEDEIIDDVAAIVLATGFDNANTLNFLPDDVLQVLEYDPKLTQCPLLLHVNSTTHPNIPDLGFVGFYRGPYWGVMEMQARFLGQLWSGDEKASKALSEDVSPIRDLRRLSRENLAQFPMGDYAYVMESFKEILELHRIDDSLGPVLPSRYLAPNAGEVSKKESAKAVLVVNKILNESAHNARYVSRAIFRALQGDWTVERSMISFISTYPSGRFLGTAEFMPRYPASEYDAEHLYAEEGDFETDNGMKFRATRRYAYRYQEATDTLSAWFVKTDNRSVDYLFHEFEVLPPEHGSGWRARAHHLCVQDTYDVIYEFRFRGVNIEYWTMKYTVRGPSKDYRIESTYRR